MDWPYQWVVDLMGQALSCAESAALSLSFPRRAALRSNATVRTPLVGGRDAPAPSYGDVHLAGSKHTIVTPDRLGGVTVWFWRRQRS